MEMEAARQRYVKFFNDADTNGDGTLDMDELTVVMRGLGYSGSDAQIRMMFYQIDTSGDNKISLEEFLAAMEEQPTSLHNCACLRAVFRTFDTDGNGEIDRSELKRAFEQMGQYFSDDDVEKMIAEADTDGSGTINYEEFINKLSDIMT